MSDLTDDDITRCEQMSDFCDEEFWLLLAEVKRHRAAKAADKERVRQVVDAAAIRVLSALENYETHDEAAHAIAARAAQQLATPLTTVMQTVRDVIATVSSLGGEHYPQRAIEDIATRVAIALTGRTDA